MTGYILKMFPRFSETFILTEILELERRGCPLRIVSLRKPDDGRFHAEVSRVASPVRYLPEHVLCAVRRVAGAHARRLLRSPLRYLAAAGLAVRLLPGSWAGFLRAPLAADALEGCDRLHAHFASLPAVTALFASKLLGVPWSFTAHAKDIFIAGRSRRLMRVLIRSAERVVTVSDYNVRVVEDLGGPDLPWRRIVRVYNGIDLQLFRPRSAAAGPGAAGGLDGGGDGEPVPHGVTRLLAVGRLVEKKGFEDLLEACAELDARGAKFLCEIIGDGPLRPRLEARIRALDLSGSIRLAGPLPRGTVVRRLQAADLFVAPCVVGRDGNRDGLPTVILEAMACGLPVVATDVTGIPEAVLDGVTGRVIPPGRSLDLASALDNLISNPLERARFGRAGREHVAERFDLRKNVNSLEAIQRGWNPVAPRRPSGARSFAPAEPGLRSLSTPGAPSPRAVTGQSR